MKVIAIELNHVIRNINRQLLKYYTKDFHPEIDIDEIDEDSNVNEDIIKFDSKYEKNNFIYVNYPYEIFGCADTMEKNLGRDITHWQHMLDDEEDEEYRIIFYSLYEDELSIQSTYFFLSKIGTRVREIIFPKDINELTDKCDVIITANKEVIEHFKDTDKQILAIDKTYYTPIEGNNITHFTKLSEIINDIPNLLKIINNSDGEQ